jgi:tripartite-type tricarboxylate transporter receptor subunit TctC
MSALSFHVRSLVQDTAIVAAVALLGISPAFTQDFFAGRSIDLLIGGAPGGGYDIYGRVVARHIGRHIPGNPAIVPKNMPGAGSIRVAGFISTVAPKDGTVIANIQPGAVMAPLLDPKAEKSFNPTALQYLANANNGTRVCVAGSKSKLRSFDDARMQKAAFGAAARGDSTYDYAFMHKRTTGALWDVVFGYSGTADLLLAIERGEIDGACGLDWATLKSQRPDWKRDKTVTVLMQDAIEPNAELTSLGVPHIMRYVTSETNRKVVELILSQQVFHRSFIAPPGIPATQLATLRKAFDDTLQDAQFLADAEKLRIDIAPLSGVRVQEVVRALYESPPAIVELARAAINP